MFHRRAAIHAEAPSFVEMGTEQEILETGIKVVDLLAPYVKGGKIGMKNSVYLFVDLYLTRSRSILIVMYKWFVNLWTNIYDVFVRIVWRCWCRQDCTYHGAY
jgi:hypothetical protein